MSTFDEDLFLKGLEQRKATLGADYVTNNLAAADEFTRPFQEAMTAWCWGFGWGDDVIDAKTPTPSGHRLLEGSGKLISCRKIVCDINRSQRGFALLQTL